MFSPGGGTADASDLKSEGGLYHREGSNPSPGTTSITPMNSHFFEHITVRMAGCIKDWHNTSFCVRQRPNSDLRPRFDCGMNAGKARQVNVPTASTWLSGG